MVSRCGLGTSELIASVSIRKRLSQHLDSSVGLRMTTLTCLTHMSLISILIFSTDSNSADAETL